MRTGVSKEVAEGQALVPCGSVGRAGYGHCGSRKVEIEGAHWSSSRPEGVGVALTFDGSE